MKRKNTAPMRTITSVDQSPLNERRWCLALECGHDVWTTATRRPTRQKARCQTCPPTGEIARGKEGLFT